MCGLLTYTSCMYNSGLQININTSRMVYSTDSLSLPVLTHRPVSISAHHPNQYSGENPPQRHSMIPSVEVYTNTNTILCCQPLGACKRYPRERMQIIGISLFFVFVTPEGFTTMVGNKGLEKARAYLNQVHLDRRLYLYLLQRMRCKLQVKTPEEHTY